MFNSCPVLVTYYPFKFPQKHLAARWLLTVVVAAAAAVLK
jgi:hypothetical protein